MATPRVMSNDVVMALTKRRSAGTTAPSLKDQCNASPTIREHLSTGPGTGMAAVIEPDRCLCMRFQPIYKKDANGKLVHVIANGSDTELVPLLVGPEYASHFSPRSASTIVPLAKAFRSGPLFHPTSLRKLASLIWPTSTFACSQGSLTSDFRRTSSRASSGSRRPVIR